MEWGRAKKFVIIMLLVLNGVLAGLNMKQKQDHTMTATQERAIFEVLSQNGITMYTELRTESAPMFRLEAEIPKYGKETLEQLFFNGEKTRVSLGEEQNIYKTDNRTLVIQGDMAVLTMDEVEKGPTTMNRAEAVKLGEKVVDKLKDTFGTMVLSNAIQNEEGWKVEFCGTYKGEPVFSNRIQVFISHGGIYKLELTYAEIKGYSSERKAICQSDEALLSFMREWKKAEQTEGGAAIQKIELGYDLLEQGKGVAGSGLYLEPCYRIYFMEGTEPYLVNAYTAKVVNKKDFSA